MDQDEVIIEEINGMDVNMSEFIDAVPLKVSLVNSVEAMEYIPADDVTNLDNMPIDIIDVEDSDPTDQLMGEEISSFDYMEMFESEEDEEDENPKVFKANINEDEPNSSPSKKEPIKKKCIKRRCRVLPPNLQGLMGEANLRFARGEKDMAVQMCERIITEVPSAPAPYETLADFHKDTNQKLSLELQLTAGFLDHTKDAEWWLNLAEKFLNTMDHKEKAVTCLNKAVNRDPKNITLYEIRAKILTDMGKGNALTKQYKTLIKRLGPENPTEMTIIAMELAKAYIRNKEYKPAADAMENLFTKCPDHVTVNEVNVILEALLPLKMYPRCLEILQKYTKIKIKYSKVYTSVDSSETKESCIIEHCTIPQNVPLELKAKCLVILIQLGSGNMALEQLPKFTKGLDLDENAIEQILDVVEAFINKKMFETGLDLLKPMIESAEFGMAAVWLLRAECLMGLGRMEEGIEAYEKVRELSPHYTSGRMELSKLYEEKGQLDRAIEVLLLDQPEAYDVSVIYRRCLLLLTAQRYDELFQSGILLFSRHCHILRKRSEMEEITSSTDLNKRMEKLHRYRYGRGQNPEDINTFVNDDLSFDDEYALFLRIVDCAYEKREYDIMQKICFSALTSKKFDQKRKHITFICLVSCIHNNDSNYGFNLIREMARYDIRPMYWNLLNIVIQRAEDARHCRYIMRKLGKQHTFSELHILHANNCLVSGTYKYALNDYISIFKIKETSLLALLVGVTHLQMACQKFASHKNQIITQATVFFEKYGQLRGKEMEHEVYYNYGRFFHQLGLLPTAVYYYKLVLNLPQSRLVKENEDLLCLKHETAYNLHLIYMRSGNPDLAKWYLDRYLVV